MTEAEKTRFVAVVQKTLAEARERATIGTYKEKNLHVILKHFYEPDTACQEVKVGKYVADILRDEEIVEIQTGSFYPMQDKIRYYLEETPYTVTVVRPICAVKWCCWIDPASGDLVSRRKSPKKGKPTDTLRDWVFLSDFICHPRFRIRFLLLEAEEYRFLNGWGQGGKRGSERYEIVPLGLLDEITYHGPDDYRSLLPDSLSDGFTASAYRKEMRLTSLAGYAALTVLCRAGLLVRGEEKIGRAYPYFRTK